MDLGSESYPFLEATEDDTIYLTAGDYHATIVGEFVAISEDLVAVDEEGCIHSRAVGVKVKVRHGTITHGDTVADLPPGEYKLDASGLKYG